MFLNNRFNAIKEIFYVTDDFDKAASDVFKVTSCSISQSLLFGVYLILIFCNSYCF